jgi:hypothetical protein
MQAEICPTLAVIAVEIIGDKLVEPNETFYLDLSNLMVGSLGADVRMLTGMRTIDNDGRARNVRSRGP